MRAIETDVAVVGGGPSGAATAYYLARRGHRVAVLERKAFPRDKPCGDGLTPRAVAVLQDMGVGGSLGGWQEVPGVRVTGDGTTLCLPFPDSRRWCGYGLVRPRRQLDQEVLANAEAAGATVLFRTRAVGALIEGGRVAGVAATGDGGALEVRAPWVVFAEGAAGLLARGVTGAGDRSRPVCLALREYRPAGPEAHAWFDTYPDLRLRGRNLPAYGWAFPVSDGLLNVGVALLLRSPAPPGYALPALLDAFVDRLRGRRVIGAHGAGHGRRGGRLPLGGGVARPHGPGYMLVGDAAGVASPFTGEGISYAYETGRLAARHLHAALSGAAVDVDAYGRDLEAAYGAYFRLGRGLVAAMARPALMRLLVGGSLRAPRAMRFALTVMTNLEDPGSGGADQYGMRALKWLADPALGRSPDARGAAARPAA